MTRAEHLVWAKNRALEYVEASRLNDAVASMMSDLSQHEELKNHAGIDLGTMLLMAGHLSTEKKVREWIVGFN